MGKKWIGKWHYAGSLDAWKEWQSYDTVQQGGQCEDWGFNPQQPSSATPQLSDDDDGSRRSEQVPVPAWRHRTLTHTIALSQHCDICLTSLQSV